LTEIVVKKASESQSYEDFLADLPEVECRWAVYDFEYEKEGAGKRNKIVFYSWFRPSTMRDEHTLTTMP
jgi:cofilin